MSTPAPRAAETIGGLSLAWIQATADIARRDGHALRAGRSPAGPVIEVQCITTGEWCTLTLEGRLMGDCAFASETDRDAALSAIQSRAIDL